MKRAGAILLLTLAAPLPARANALELTADGVQIYTCTAGAWKLKAPEATLQDPAGHLTVHHYAGPTWQAADGSQTTATPLTVSPAPIGDAIPWLVLHATPGNTPGILSRVAYITRTNTAGGKPPAQPCTPGNETRVPYRATYTFFSP